MFSFNCSGTKRRRYRTTKALSYSTSTVNFHNMENERIWRMDLLQMDVQVKYRYRRIKSDDKRKLLCLEVNLIWKSLFPNIIDQLSLMQFLNFKIEAINKILDISEDLIIFASYVLNYNIFITNSQTSTWLRKYSHIILRNLDLQFFSSLIMKNEIDLLCCHNHE